MRLKNGAAARPVIDVLAFPPDEPELRRWQVLEIEHWNEFERRARIALFVGAGMFLAWAADVGAAFETGQAGGATFFGVASVPLAIVVVLAYLAGRWALERARRGRSQVLQRYDDVTMREARPLRASAQTNPAVAQYLRCVGRQKRALRNLERSALLAFANASENQDGAAAWLRR